MRKFVLAPPVGPYSGSMSFLCPYCGETKDEADRTVEHPVPARMGGNLEIDTCDECNEGAARSIDNPILFGDGDVRVLRATYDVRSPRRRGRPARDEFIGIFSGQDAKAVWRPRAKGGDVAQLTATDPVPEEDGTFTVITPVEDGEKHLERALEKLRAAHPGKTVELLETEQLRGEVVFEHSWGVGLEMWPRFMAKIALALGHLAIEDFDHTREAKLLRWLMRRGRLHADLLAPGTQLAAVPAQLEAGDRDRELLCPHEHLVAVATGQQDGLIFSAIFFGELRYQLSVASKLKRLDGGRAWILDGRGKPYSGNLREISFALTERLAMFGSTEKLRSWRPRTRLLRIRGRGQVQPMEEPR
jgi:hypothetical protein